MAWQDAFKGFDIKKIGAGRRFRSGHNYQEERVGLDGAFRELKDPAHGGIGSNLSAQEISKFKELLEDKLKRKYEFTKGFDRYDRRDLIHHLEQMRLRGEISNEDERDFRYIIDKLSA